LETAGQVQLLRLLRLLLLAGLLLLKSLPLILRSCLHMYRRLAQQWKVASLWRQPQSKLRQILAGRLLALLLHRVRLQEMSGSATRVGLHSLQVQGLRWHLLERLRQTHLTKLKQLELVERQIHLQLAITALAELLRLRLLPLLLLFQFCRLAQVKHSVLKMRQAQMQPRL
jgi:hypothetical protein